MLAPDVLLLAVVVAYHRQSLVVVFDYVASALIVQARARRRAGGRLPHHAGGGSVAWDLRPMQREEERRRVAELFDRRSRPVMTCCMQSVILSVLVAAGAASVIAGDQHEHRQHGAHVHGSGRLNIVVDGGEAYLELIGPAANLVGFEHAPTSAADHAALDKAVAALEGGDALFRFNDAAGCRLADVEIDSALIAHDDASHPDHDTDSRHGETHADMVATYRFRCTEPGELERLSVEVFAAFPGTERLEVRFVLGDKQGAAALTATDHRLSF